MHYIICVSNVQIKQNSTRMYRHGILILCNERIFFCNIKYPIFINHTQNQLMLAQNSCFYPKKVLYKWRCSTVYHYMLKESVILMLRHIFGNVSCIYIYRIKFQKPFCLISRSWANTIVKLRYVKMLMQRLIFTCRSWHHNPCSFPLASCTWGTVSTGARRQASSWAWPLPPQHSHVGCCHQCSSISHTPCT